MTYQKLIFLICLVALVVLLAWTSSATGSPQPILHSTATPAPPTPTPTPKAITVKSAPFSIYGILWMADPDKNVNLKEANGRDSNGGVGGRSTVGEGGPSEGGGRTLPTGPDLRNP